MFGPYLRRLVSSTLILPRTLPLLPRPIFPTATFSSSSFIQQQSGSDDVGADTVSPTEKPKPKPGKSRTPPKPRPKAVLVDLIESDLEETWVRGSGPGGQAINKTNISCSLLHIPTGIRIQCHETRSRELNRLKARRRLQERLDLLSNPGTSMLETKWKRERAKKEAKKRKGKRKDSSTAEDGDDGVESVREAKEKLDEETKT